MKNSQIETQKPNYSFALSTLISLFFMWGFITCMNDILIPHLKELFQLTYLQSMLVQFAFFGAYFIGSLAYFLLSYFYGDPINKIGYKGGLLVGLVLSALGCVLFYPAEELLIYNMFLLALFTLGLGFTLLQISANPYVAILGSEESSSSRLNLAQAFNSLGTTIAPILGGYLIFDFFGQGGEMTAEATKIPYLIFAAIFILLALFIYFVKLPEFMNDDSSMSGLGALAFPQLKMGIFGIFFYVGAEVAIGSLIISFLSLDEIMGFNEAVAKNYLALYWGGAMIGRFLGSISLNSKLSQAKRATYMVLTAIVVVALIYSIVDIPFADFTAFLVFVALNLVAFAFGKSISSRTLIIFSIINILLLVLTLVSAGVIAMWCLLAIGLFNSIMWSNIFTLSITGLGKYTSQGSSLLIMGILGGALLPLVQGALADAYGVRLSFVLPMFCYAYIAFYGIYCLKNLKSSASVE